jgi:hypothetical protein
MVIWQLGWVLWGANPVPYQVFGLLLHAGVALMLGLWLAEATQRQTLGWLAGALFGVFPLHLEAVGWISAHWDALATLLAITSLYCFTRWWRRRETDGINRLSLYILSLLFYTLAVFAKESMLAFAPMLGVAAWLSTPRLRRYSEWGWRAWSRLALFILPFFLPVAANLAMRLLFWGTLGGYRHLRTDIGNYFWDNLATDMRLLLAPVNVSLLGSLWSQLVGALSTIALIIGLVLYGRRYKRPLLAALSWLGVAIAPVISMPSNTFDLQMNRYLYLPAAGYCVGVATLLYAAVVAARRWRSLAMSLVAALILLSIGLCWIQLRPWHTATVQTREIVAETLRLIPPRHSRPQGMIWYVEKAPDNYKGAFVLRRTIASARVFLSGVEDDANVENTAGVLQAPIANDSRDAFAVRFNFNENESRFHVDYAVGITADQSLPSGTEVGEGLRVWDFGDCASDVLDEWQVVLAAVRCEPDNGLMLDPGGEDPQMVSVPIEVQARQDGARFVRLRASMTHAPSGIGPQRHVSEWFWKGPTIDFTAERMRLMPIRQDGKPYTYWAIVPVTEVEETITGLRFDPVNGPIPTVVHWIAMDLVK